MTTQANLPGIFNAEEFWAGKDYKKWVATVSNHEETETLYVASATEKGAIGSARYNTTLKGRLTIKARLAHPEDIGAHHRDDPNPKLMWM